MSHKLLSLALVLALLLTPCLTLAESYQSYAAEDGSLSFFYPQDWLLLSRENIDSVLDIAATVEGMAEMVESARAQIEQTGIIVLISEDSANNINLQLQDAGMELTGETLTTLAPSLQEAIMGTFGDVSFRNTETIEINGTDTLLMQYAYSLAGLDFSVMQAYMPIGTTLLVATMTCSVEDQFFHGAEALGVVLGGLQFS